MNCYRYTSIFLKECVIHGIEYMSQEPSRILGKRLAIFRDVMIQDSATIRLHKSLIKSNANPLVAY
jgi:hypothetical protein